MLGRVEVEPRDIDDFLDEERVRGELEVLCRWGWTPNADQTRCTVDLESSISSAAVRTLQRSCSPGGSA
jgi:hypothetical protein